MYDESLLILLNMISTIGILLTVILMYWQIRKNSLFAKANFIIELFMRFYRDDWIREAFYSIEYERFTYDGSFHGSEIEKKIDYMLGYLDLLGILVKSQVIDLDSIKPLYYEIYIIYNNNEIRKYIKFLRKWYKYIGIEQEPFEGFQYVGREIKNIYNTFSK